MENRNLQALVVKPNRGRKYSMGRMSAVFKADREETDSCMSVSEWWLEPNTEGPHIHQHPEAHLFYVLEGTLAIYLEKRDLEKRDLEKRDLERKDPENYGLEGKDWLQAEKGSYIFIPGGMEHSFENQSDNIVGFMSINTPGGFEEFVPLIVDYLKENPLGDAKK